MWRKIHQQTTLNYWKKRSYIFQGYVVEDGLKEENRPENANRRFIIGPQIFQLIRGALLDPEMDDLPTDAVVNIQGYMETKAGKKPGTWYDNLVITDIVLA